MARSGKLTNKQYVPSLQELQACCTRNYASLERLLKGMGTETHLLYGEQHGQRLTLTIEDQAPYTTTLRLSQKGGLGPNYLKPTMQVRMYHDARMAEVLSSQQISGVRARYDYPNSRMHQRDEKMQINQFLADWLSFCLEHGLTLKNVFNKSFS